MFFLLEERINIGIGMLFTFKITIFNWDQPKFGQIVCGIAIISPHLGVGGPDCCCHC